MIETIQLAHMPAELTLYVAVYRNVENAAFLKEQLLAGNENFEYAFVDASMVLSSKHVLAAAFRAMNDYLHDRLKSRNIHSEIVFALSPNNNIGEAFRRFGLQDTTRNLLVLKVATTEAVTFETVSRHLSVSIQGMECDFTNENLQDMSDVARIRKVYKLAAAPQPKSQKLLNGATNGHSNVTSDLEVQVIGLMALRGAT